MLAIEVEFLTGVSVAASPYRREEPEWPPHPDRLFQSLVATWGRNNPPNEEEKLALKWLEALNRNSLEVYAPAARPRTVATVFVPPNDARTASRAGSKPPKKLGEAIYVVPELRKNRQPRVFPAVVVDPVSDTNTMATGNGKASIYYIWRNSHGLESHRDAIKRLAREVNYLGHSHTLVRVALVDEATAVVITDGLRWVGSEGTALRCPHEGRLKHLENQYERSMKSTMAVRPNPSLVAREFRRSHEALPTTLFDDKNFITFEDAGGFCPSLSAFPLIAKRLRDALLKIADDEGISIPTLLSGHNRDKRPTTDAHLSMVPLADVGWGEYSQGRLMGLTLVWPRSANSEDRRNVLKTLEKFFMDKEDHTGVLHFGHNGSWQLRLSPEPVRKSLKFKRYVEPAKRWGTVLPVVLDRHPKNRPNQDVSAIVVNACRNAGLEFEAVKDLKMEVHQYAAVRGAPSVQEVVRMLPKDSPYRGRPLVHLVLDFLRPVQGPLILGAGRFRGLGLCLPLK